ncbi:maleylpyruvate isomerase family mycothiol-dependent enzyme [Streptomyces sp. NPDC001719]
MDSLAQFHREAQAFEAVVRRAAGASAAPVPTCPAWSVADLTLHLGAVHRFVTGVVREGAGAPPAGLSLSLGLPFLRLPAGHAGWPEPDRAPNLGPVPENMADWFAAGARDLEEAFREAGPAKSVWSWAPDGSVAFWTRTQAIEAAVHRWDAENAMGTARPVDEELAADAVAQMFEVTAPAWRAWAPAQAGAGERFRFRRTDGTGDWTARFDGDAIHLTEGADPGADVELAGTASDLMLFLWGRIPADRLDVTGDRGVLDRYFALVPPR